MSARRSRAQLVLVAAGVVAVALAPVVLAYLQLGYHADVRASADYDVPAANAERFLSRAVHEAGANATGEHAWADRNRTIDATRRALAPRLDRLRTARLDRGTAYGLAYNDSAATDWAATASPSGPDRQFGPVRHTGASSSRSARARRMSWPSRSTSGRPPTAAGRR